MFKNKLLKSYFWGGGECVLIFFHNLKVIHFLLFDTRIRLKYTSKKNSVNETLSTKQTAYHVNFGGLKIYISHGIRFRSKHKMLEKLKLNE